MKILFSLILLVSSVISVADKNESASSSQPIHPKSEKTYHGNGA